MGARRTILAALWAAGLVGCGGYGSAYNGAASIAEATCEAAFSCQQAYPAEAAVSHEDAYGVDEASCAARIGPDPAREDSWDDAEDGGTVTYDKGQAKACAVAVRGSTCESFWAEPPAEACGDAIVGTLAVEAECRIDAVCVSGLCVDGRCAGVPGSPEAETE